MTKGNRRLPYLDKPLTQVFIRTTDLQKNESIIYGKFEGDGFGVVKPLQVLNYIADDFLIIPEAIEAFKFWDNKKGKTYAEINVILEGLKACNTSLYAHIIKNLMGQIEELENYTEAENNVNQIMPIGLDKHVFRLGQLQEAIKKLEEAITILADEY
jgi:hypothetical protein